jgi:hypothetical protein
LASGSKGPLPDQLRLQRAGSLAGRGPEARPDARTRRRRLRARGPNASLRDHDVKERAAGRRAAAGLGRAQAQDRRGSGAGVIRGLRSLPSRATIIPGRGPAWRRAAQALLRRQQSPDATACGWLQRIRPACRSGVQNSALCNPAGPGHSRAWPRSRSTPVDTTRPKRRRARWRYVMR